MEKNSLKAEIILKMIDLIKQKFLTLVTAKSLWTKVKTQQQTHENVITHGIVG